jgi:hypothetical protein
MPRLSFQTSLLLAPLAYAVHHFEEHVIFDFRAWRLAYFPDNNALSTEALLAVLSAITLIYLLLHAAVRTRVSAWMALLFLMATQVHNVLFHLGGTIAFQHFSPGLITALVLYVPANLLICKAALAEGLVTPRILTALFLAGGSLFWAFEFLGPVVLLVATLASWGWALVSARAAGARPLNAH